jgi:hypothetical protein
MRWGQADEVTAADFEIRIGHPQNTRIYIYAKAWKLAGYGKKMVAPFGAADPITAFAVRFLPRPCYSSVFRVCEPVAMSEFVVAIASF